MIWKTQKRFRSENHNVFTEEINQLSSNHHKRIQSIGFVETYTYGTSKDLVCKKEKIKYENKINQYKNV